MTATTLTFHERLLPGPGGWLGTVGLGAIAAIALWPLHTTAAVVVGLLVCVGSAAALAVTSPVVEVSDGVLRAGSARIPVTLLGPAEALDVAAMRHELGPGLDGRAYVCLRAWARTGVRVTLDDPADPTPYWLVSTRRPQLLVEALRG
ncbi:DUF3093 domain-containing protein [Promicromonospora iranensis]|uniref:DUF3093 family protein n=1 Tax=Promicromonospora iranensis TaxID=1105144 RepID=A0ABU2CV19_9MICO|nr:DUF3093 domain-containing protein [Promicromonospora iranensis]MDR7385182.1 hypothetical protein [Promicromonospora iranensis]